LRFCSLAASIITGITEKTGENK